MKPKDILDWVKNNRVEWLAGVTTGLTAVPTAVAFAILAGVSPAVGLRGTWIIMLIMALFGGEELELRAKGTSGRSGGCGAMRLPCLCVFGLN